MVEAVATKAFHTFVGPSARTRTLTYTLARRRDMIASSPSSLRGKEKLGTLLVIFNTQLQLQTYVWFPGLFFKRIPRQAVKAAFYSQALMKQYRREKSPCTRRRSA